MASNKKKDAAALYELLDKSTLKVTRKPGTPLKIPSWWSGRNNPVQGRRIFFLVRSHAVPQ